MYPHGHNERKKARAKFYFFDCGVVRAMQNRLNDPPTEMEMGFLFENWLLAELIKINHYYSKGHEFSFWRKRNHEMDIIISNGRKILMAIECKSGKVVNAGASVEAFKTQFSKVPVVIVSLQDKMKRKLKDNVELFPWKEFINRYVDL